MKIICQFGLLFFLLFNCQLDAQIHVKHDASGSNDGSSWENAFVDLSIAINSSTKGDEIWVAEGVYLPGEGTPNRESFFAPPHDLKLYGGFDGTETSLSERDVKANPTTLSGDVLGDDLPGDFTNKKTDNCRHVMWLTDTITTASTIDGFIIEGGHTDPSTGTGDDRRGGGILCYGAPSIRNCVFRENFGHFGGGLYPRGGTASGVVIENCQFEYNMGTFGSGVYCNNRDLTVIATQFNNNRASNRGAAIYAASSVLTDISNCEFKENTSVERGGALLISNAPTKIRNCQFDKNEATTRSGGAIHVRSSDDDVPSVVDISNCEFINGTATWGGAISAWNTLTVLNVDNCIISGNVAVNHGGGVHCAFGATINIQECEITGNNADIGGAINSQNDTSTINLTNVLLLQNNTTSIGGAIRMTSDTIWHAQKPQLNIYECQIEGNIAMSEGGAIYISNSNAYIENSLIATNFSTDEDDGGGGALSINSRDTFDIIVQFLNSTIVDNSASFAAGILTYEDETSSTTIVSQNSIYQNAIGENHEVEGGTPTIQSNGGNLSSDNSFGGLLNGTNDLENVDPIFVNPAGGNFELSDQSPAVNSGIAANAPATDILGRARVGNVDMGAYENQNVTSIWDEKKSFGELLLRRDNDQLVVQFIDEYTGEINWSIIDMNGKINTSGDWVKESETLNKTISVSELASGSYVLRIAQDRFQNSGLFIK